MSSFCLNLQVATDTRLWLYGALQDTRGYLADLIKTAITRAELDVDVVMPGFTHLQVPNLAKLLMQAPRAWSLPAVSICRMKQAPMVLAHACTAPCIPAAILLCLHMSQFPGSPLAAGRGCAGGPSGADEAHSCMDSMMKCASCDSLHMQRVLETVLRGC